MNIKPTKNGKSNSLFFFKTSHLCQKMGIPRNGTIHELIIAYFLLCDIQIEYTQPNGQRILTKLFQDKLSKSRTIASFAIREDDVKYLQF